MKRRRLLSTLGSAAASWPLTARAQKTPKTAKVGVLGGVPDNPMVKAAYTAFVDELKKFGWNEGRNLTVDHRYHNVAGVDLAAEVDALVKSKVDVIVSTGPEVCCERRWPRPGPFPSPWSRSISILCSAAM